MIVWREPNHQFIRLLIGDEEEARYLLGWLYSQKDRLISNKIIITIIGFGIGKRKIKFHATLLNMSFFKNFLIWYFAPIR
jgi:hypothetical protein